MPGTTAPSISTLGRRFGAFVTERYPFALAPAVEAFEAVSQSGTPAAASPALDEFATRFAPELRKRLSPESFPLSDLSEPTPAVTAAARFETAVDELIDGCEGFFAREAIRASLTPEERREILRGMLLTRATDNRLKTFFTGGEVRYRDAAFQGKGFRSLGQEAIYAAGIRLRRGERYRDGGSWRGDVVAPVIRDLGMTLAMRHDEEAVAMILRAQMGKAGPPMFGKDLHTGDWAWGVLPAA